MKKNKKYDKNGRLVYDFIQATETLYTYKYKDENRTVKIANKNNRSNHTTIIEQIKDASGNYRDISKTEEGDVYTIKVTYNEAGQQVKYEQINKKKKTNFIKTFYYPDNSETHVYIMNYNGKKEVGFKADVKKLMRKS